MSNATRRIVTTRMTLDLNIPDIQRDITVTQGDTNRRFEITLVDSGHPYVLDANDKWSVILTGIKPSGASLYNGCDVAGGKIVYDFASGDQITTEAGAFGIQFDIYDESGEVIATPKIWVTVTPNANRDAVSEDQFTKISEWVNQLNEYGAKEAARDERVDEKLEELDVSEAGRVSAEKARVTAEDGRVSEEKARAAAETQRELNEAARQGLQQQVNNLLNTPAGSTTADLALYDLKLGADGVTYETPGIAVRAQLGRLQGKVPEIDKRLANVESLLDPKLFVEDKTAAAVKSVPATAAPYAKVLEIGGKTRKCANLLGGEALANKIKSVNANAVIDTTAKTVVYYASSMQNKVLFTDFKPNTRYTFILKGKASSRHLNMNIKYTDGTAMDAWMFPTKDTEATLCLVSAPGKSISEMVGVYNDGNTTLYYNECGIFEGVLTVNDFEPYFEGLRSAPVTEVESVGVNLLNPAEIRNGYYDVFSNGVFVEQVGGYWKGSAKIACYPSAYYTLTNVEVTSGYWVFFDANDIQISYTPLDASKLQVQTPANCRKLAFYANFTGDGMLNKGTTAKPYTPYRRHTLPIPEKVRPANGITENVYDYIEWAEDGSVKQGVRCGFVDLASLPWSLLSSTAAMVSIDDMSITPAWDVSKLPSKITNMLYDGTLPLFYLFFEDGAYTSIDELRADLNGVQLVYELAKPIVTDISDLLSADNLIPVEAGGTVTFVNEYEYDVPNKVRYQLKRT